VLLETLQSLVDKSLLRRDQAGLAPRLRILETVREYALERLEASREAEMLRARHAAYCLALVHHVNSDPVEAARPNQLESDHDNIRAALRWSLEGGDLAMGLRLATALRRFWWRGGYLGEGRRWTSELLHEAGQGPDLRATPEWAAALGLAGYLAWAQADYDTAVTLHRQALERWVGLGNRRGVAAAQGFLGTALCWQGDLSAGASQLDQALAGWRALHHPVGAGNALFQLGLIALFQHRFDDADGSLRAALALHRTSANRLDAAYDLTMIGYVAVHRGRLVEAQDSLGQAADEMSRTDDRWGVLFLLESAAALAVAAGEPLRGLELIGTASALRERTGAALPPPFRERLARWIARARASLSEAEAETALAAGRARAPGQAIDADELQALVGCTTVQDPSPRSPPRLTPREKQIVVLLARGGTNQQIAGELVLSPRTVESHVSHILGKLDFTTRAQIAAWASRQSLVGMPSSR
jgi:DNA-binding CsgD family transcriptional regulator/tetratricopeptide (TPR) repeat protein